MECQEIDQIVWIFKRIDGSKEKDVFAMFATYVAPVTQTMQHITRSRMTADRNASRIDQLGYDKTLHMTGAAQSVGGFAVAAQLTEGSNPPTRPFSSLWLEPDLSKRIMT
ncbi:hypothetical protein RB195_009394 [Necator americanus]|uniref:Uncharacterized protein n=1 Tax=Necator americanus TaxID=51031 RepID=A0ABR1CUD4_NECAM